MIVGASNLNEFSLKFRTFRLEDSKKLKCTMLHLAYTANSISDFRDQSLCLGPVIEFGFILLNVSIFYYD